MEEKALVIFDNVAEIMLKWTEKRIGKFVKAYYEARKNGVTSPDTGDDAIDMLISCLLATSVKRGRGGQPGNSNARRSETNKNECETNTINNNIIEKNIKEENENNIAHIRSSELLPFPKWMTTEEKKKHLWRDVVDNKGEYPEEMLKDFAKYYGMPSAKKLGSLVCEECVGWDTKTMLERWAKQAKH